MWNKYKLFNTDEFDATGLCSRKLQVVLEDIGLVTVLISKGNIYSITFRGVYLPVNLEGINPYIDSGYGSFIDAENNVHLGIEVPE